MNILTIILLAFGAISLIVASVYFYIFTKSKERFIRFWGLCWICYSCSLLLLSLGNEIHALFPVLRKLFDMANILFLLFGVYSFQNIKIRGYWFRFSLYVLIWGGLSIIYRFDLMSFYIPASIYQICMTAVMCYVIVHYWEVPFMEKMTSSFIFALWGFGKAAISIIEIIKPEQMFPFYLAEVIFSSVLNFMVVFIYLQRAESKLYRAENQFRLIAENAFDVIFFYRKNPPAFTYVTPSAEHVLGYLPEDFYEASDFMYQIIEQNDKGKIDELFSYDRPKDEKSEILRLFRKNSQEIWAEISTTVVYENNQAIALEGVIRDISTTKEAEENMLASKKAKEVFLSYISHELKTPVTSMLAYATALRQNTFESDEKRQEAIDVFYKKTLTLERLINDLFQLSKLETKQFSFEFMVMDVQDLCESLIEDTFFDIKNAGLRMSLKVDKASLENLSIVVDEARIKQVFSNIITNAIRFSPKGGTIKINIEEDLKKNSLLLSVRDQGPGIASSDIPHIFDRFYRVASGEHSASENTSGLGMTIAKEIVNAHGGTISIKSRVKRETTFIVTLPLYNE